MYKKESRREVKPTAMTENEMNNCPTPCSTIALIRSFLVPIDVNGDIARLDAEIARLRALRIEVAKDPTAVTKVTEVDALIKSVANDKGDLMVSSPVTIDAQILSNLLTSLFDRRVSIIWEDKHDD